MYYILSLFRLPITSGMAHEASGARPEEPTVADDRERTVIDTEPERAWIRRATAPRSVGVAAAGVAIVAIVLSATLAVDPEAPSGRRSRRSLARPESSISSTTSLALAGPSESLAAALDPVWRTTPGGCLRVSTPTRVLYEMNPDLPLAPASVTKLFTAAAALDTIGPEASFRTSIKVVEVADGVVSGDMWLVGGGDPVLGTDAWAAQLPAQGAPHTSLDDLADGVVAAGVRRIVGRIVGDESRFDGDRYVDSWPDRLVSDGEAGPLSALTVNDGFRTWGHPGVAFADPPTDAARLFEGLLEERGIEVVGGSTSGVAPATAVEVAGVDSPRLGVLVHAMLRDSDNGTAELLVKEVGRRRRGSGSTAAGTRAIADHAAETGVPVEGIVLADGSGLSDVAKLTCRALTALLDLRSAALDGRLAVAGRDGTLTRRFLATPAEGRLRAKTGSLEGMAALAGYVDAPSGIRLSFAYIVSGLERGASARPQQDALGSALATTTP